MDTPVSDFVHPGSLAELPGEGRLAPDAPVQNPSRNGWFDMKASLFCTARYMGAAPHDMWPLWGEYYSGDAAGRSMQTSFDQFRCADEFSFDWVTVAEHHYSGFSLTANLMVMAGALSQIVRRAKIAVLKASVETEACWTILVGLHWRGARLGRLTVMSRGQAAAYEWIRPVSR